MAFRITGSKYHWVITFHIFFTALLFAQPENIRFEHLGVEQGLSQSIVFSIVQDDQGFIWFGTQNGLNKYDGYSFTVYKNNPNDTLSLSDTWISTLYVDHSGKIWIGTRSGGLCRYDRENDIFIRYKHEKGNPNSLCGNTIVSVFETNDQVLWIGCGNGLNRYNRKSDDFTRYYPEDKKAEFKVNINWIGSITEDYSGQLWVGTWNQGLFKYDKERDVFHKYIPDPEYSNIFKNQFIWRLATSHQNDKNILWMGSDKYGLYRINIDNGEIKDFMYNEDNPASISDNAVLNIYKSGKKGKELWVCTRNGGLNRFDINSEKFISFRHQPGVQESISDNSIQSILKDKSGVMWVGTLNGVNKFEPDDPRFKTIQESGENHSGLVGNIISTIYESIEGDKSILWMGSTTEGLNRLDRKTGQFSRYKNDPKNINSLSSNSIFSIIESNSENERVLWIATAFGLNKLDIKTGKVTRYYILGKDPAHNGMWTLCEDKYGIIWIGTQSTYLYSFDPETKQFTGHHSFGRPIYTLKLDAFGILWIGTERDLYQFNPETKEEHRYYHKAGDLKSISDNNISCIFEDHTGTLWIGTSNGLNKFNRSSETFIHFNTNDGLPKNVIRGILEDSHGTLWISTDKGITKFNPKNKTVRNFTVSDGLSGDEFIRGASFQDQSGDMFFGSRNGLTYFYPDSIKVNDYVPPIVFTDFQIFNKSIQKGQNSPLKKQLSLIDEITLSYDQSVFSLEFAALDYHHPAKNKYAYKMDGVDPYWVFTGASRRFATYTQLGPGEYTFRVKGTNNDGIWNEKGASIKITILPPWWKTWWAYSGYAIIFFAVLLTIRHYELNRKYLAYTLKLEQVEAEKLKELDQLKSRFFASVSHEFRTPLTLIQDPIQQLLDGSFGGNITAHYKMILRNTRRLLQLINQLLDISKLETGKMKLQARPENIVELTRQLTMAFESLASINGVDLRFTSPEEEITVHLDREQYEKIITNLLSNAFKFTKTGGQVTVEISLPTPDPRLHAGTVSRDGRFVSPLPGGDLRVGSSKVIEIYVRDTGSGITADHLPYIFDRFYKVRGTYTREIQGNGIGLALTKELVELHRGEISVESEIGKGTEFIIRLPLGKEHLKAEEIIDIPPGLILKERIDESPFEGGVRGMYGIEKSVSPPIEAPILLIVEDNADMRTYIREMLIEIYKVIEAEDGQKGFEKAVEIIPDMIISDVMMSEMDGYQLCEKLKSDERTSHIPVILLTAKSSGESKIEGLEVGADDYLIKPFDAKELKTRIHNLIEQRRKLRKRFSKEIKLEPKDVAVTSADERFLDRTLKIIENNISNPDFRVTQLVDEIGLSRMQLYRKIHSLTDQSTSEFMRTIRLKRAAKLLEKHSGNISEIAYQVGFNNPAYFSECFKKQFEISPSEYSTNLK